MIEVIAATRKSDDEFWTGSALGVSLKRLARDSRLVPHIAYSNRRGLPDIYNERIKAGGEHDVLLFTHDDLWLDDFFVVQRVLDGLRAFDVIGVAGNRRRVARQPAWLFNGRNAEGRFVWDHPNLSGGIGHGKSPFGPVSLFGPVPAACELMDGVFLATRRSTLASAGVLFDPQFDFHFYDLDFCRSARAAGLRLGTWPIAMTHQSGGAFGGEGWNQKYRQYLEKWRE